MSHPRAHRRDICVMREGGRWRLVTPKGVPFGPSYRKQSEAVTRCNEINRLRRYARASTSTETLIEKMRRAIGI